jgi:hypothetical protein
VDEAEQDVLGPDVVVVEHPGFFLSQDDDPAGTVGKSLEHPWLPALIYMARIARAPAHEKCTAPAVHSNGRSPGVSYLGAPKRWANQVDAPEQRREMRFRFPSGKATASPLAKPQPGRFKWRRGTRR